MIRTPGHITFLPTRRVQRISTAVLLLLCFAGELLAQADWPSVGSDPGAMRYSTLDQITRHNVAKLQPAWTFHTGGSGGSPPPAIQCTPIVIGGMMYLTSPDTQVIAVDGATGTEKWRYNPHRTRHRYLYNRGVAWWSNGSQRRILFATPDGFLYSLDADTGRPDPKFGVDGVLDLRIGLEQPLSVDRVYGATSAPVIFENRVILGFTLDEGYVGGPGDVRAFDVKTGAETWRFHTIPRPGEFGHETWGADSWRHRTGVNSWSGATVDPKRGLVFVGLGSPGYDFYGGDRPGDNLFANCVVALDARTGRRVWHQQLVHHDLWDYDLPCPPVLVTVRQDGKAIDGVAQVTKQGFLFLFERATGRPLFDVVEKPVPQSTMPGERSSPTQPFPTQPAPFVQQGFVATDVTDRSSTAAAAVLARIKATQFGPVFSPPSLEGSTANPGTLGGGNWSGASFDPVSGWLYVNANALPRLFRLVPGPNPREPYVDQGELRILDPDGYPGIKPPWGTLSAIDLNRGEIVWQVPLGEFPELKRLGAKPTGTRNLGGSMVTAGGLVFIGATVDRNFRAFDAQSGEVLWEHALPFAAHAAPSTYAVDGRQYVVIAAGGGGKLETPSGDAYVAFALPATR